MIASSSPPVIAVATAVATPPSPQKKRGRPKNKTLPRKSTSSPPKKRRDKEPKKSDTPSSTQLPPPSPPPQLPPPSPPHLSPSPTEPEKLVDLGVDAYGFYVDRFSGHGQFLPTLLAPQAWRPHILPRIIAYSASMASDISDQANNSSLKTTEKDVIVKKASTLYALLDKLAKEVLTQMSDGIASSMSRLSNSETMGHGVPIPPPIRTVVTSGKALTAEDGVASHKKRQRRTRKPVAFTIQSKGGGGGGDK